MIIIATPSLIPHDAVGNDVRGQHKALKDEGYETYIFCENYFEDGYSRNFLINKSELFELIKNPFVTLIYHHSIFWELGEEILSKANCKVFIKYHNITPPEFFYFYSKNYTEACLKGREQTCKFVKMNKFSFMSDSNFNAKELFSLGARNVITVPVFHRLEDFNKELIDPNLAEKLINNKLNILFVGRFVPNKGHKHLLHIVKRYIELFDSDIVLHIVGSIDKELMSYFEEISELIRKFSLSENVMIHGKVTFSQLYTFYTCCHAFLVVSEHEGFCVPVIEAQYNSLPVIAYGGTAVGETVGPNQFVFNKINYNDFAHALRLIRIDDDYRFYLTNVAKENLKRFNLYNIKEKFLCTLNIF